MHGGSITASDMAKNLQIPLSTIYDHLKTLEFEGYIVAKEERIKNLIKKTWFRTEKRINPKETLVKNIYHNKSVPTDPVSAASYIKFLIATLKEKLNKLEQVGKDSFIEYQKSSKEPFNVLQLFLTKEDYKFVMEKIFELHTELQKRNEEAMNYQRTILLEEERYLFFYLALPDLLEAQTT